MTMPDIYASSNRPSKHRKQKRMELQRERPLHGYDLKSDTSLSNRTGGQKGRRTWRISEDLFGQCGLMGMFQNTPPASSHPPKARSPQWRDVRSVRGPGGHLGRECY